LICRLIWRRPDQGRQLRRLARSRAPRRGAATGRDGLLRRAPNREPRREGFSPGRRRRLDPAPPRQQSPEARRFSGFPLSTGM